jgi:hypothetical protein
MTTSNDPARDFELAGVRVGRGLIPLTQDGRITVAAGTLSLYAKRGRLIAAAPVSEVSARRLGNAVRIKVGGRGYNLDANQVRMTSIGLRVQHDFRFRRQFLALLAAAGAQVKR